MVSKPKKYIYLEVMNRESVNVVGRINITDLPKKNIENKEDELNIKLSFNYFTRIFFYDSPQEEFDFKFRNNYMPETEPEKYIPKPVRKYYGHTNRQIQILKQLGLNHLIQ